MGLLLVLVASVSCRRAADVPIDDSTLKSFQGRAADYNVLLVTLDNGGRSESSGVARAAEDRGGRDASS